ncbi:uncharacterized protein LOC141899898 [Tubulanus polymorphus]|uniref:uncharacterized protein LOC141899898 n=1 Tax=Tubulanus polymorphus TaxID=672921 RepID=UPI003DA1F87B
MQSHKILLSLGVLFCAVTVITSSQCYANKNKISEMAADFIKCFVNDYIAPFTYSTGLDGHNKWELVFVASANTGTSIFDYWTRVRSDNCSQKPNPKTKCDCTWKSALVDIWDKICIKEVLIKLYKDEETVAFAKFDGDGSTKFNWFSPERLGESSWLDLKPGGMVAETNYFSMQGHTIRVTELNRRFFINERYGGCPNDRLWMVVADPIQPRSPGCSYDKKSGWPHIYYSPKKTRSRISSLAEADQMAIYIKR